MKKSITDRIEQYIKVLIARSSNRQIEIQRAELAETFACVPSQVTYVINTRFTEQDGYYKESRRGGRGYVRITEIRCGYGDLQGDHQILQYIGQLSRDQLLNDCETAIIKHIAVSAGQDLPPEYSLKVYQAIALALQRFVENKR